MAKALTEQEREARIAALEEAADHLDMAWTGDATEKAQGEIIAAQLRKRAERIALGVGG
jgi:surface antigen